MNRMFFKVCVVATVVLFGLSGPLLASRIPVFEYNFPASSSDLSTGTVLDVSTAGHNATATGFPSTGLSSNVPTGMSGNSIDFGTFSDVRQVVTDDTLLLNNADVAANGGFVLDTWAYLTDTGNCSLINYAGTEQTRVFEGKFAFTVSNSTWQERIIQASWSVSTDTWYHVVGIFEAAEGEYSDGTLYGTISLYVDDVLIDTKSSYKTDFGDSLERSIGVGAHPNSTTSTMSGLLYNPKVSFLVPEPGTFSLLACGLLGLLCYAWRKRK